MAGDTARYSVRQGAALLEVVVALSIFLVAMAVVGLTFRNGERNVELADQMTRAMLMTERLLGEMDTGILKMDEREQSGWFGEEAMPGMAWKLEINPHEDIKGLLNIDIRIFMGDPDASDEQHQLVLLTRVQRPEPKGIDFEKDFGLEQDQIQQLADAIPGGAAVFDPTDFDPRMLARLDLDTLKDLLPTLIQMFGASFLGGDSLNGILQALQKGDLTGVQDMARQAAGSGAGLPGSGQTPAGGTQASQTPPGGQSGSGKPPPPKGTRQGIGQRAGGGGRP